METCACDKKAWVIVRGVPMCRDCYYTDIGKAHELDEGETETFRIRKHKYENDKI